MAAKVTTPARRDAPGARARDEAHPWRGAAAEIYVKAAPEFRASISEPDFERLVAG
ncbi:MAG TPA: hypothetical protein VGP64_03110 [Polyangia bacterium]|jgi:hypothetical protein